MINVKLDAAECLKVLADIIARLSAHFSAQSTSPEQAKQELIQSMTQNIMLKSGFSGELRKRKYVERPITKTDREHLSLEISSLIWSIQGIQYCVNNIRGGVDLPLLAEMADQAGKSVKIIEEKKDEILNFMDATVFSSMADSIDALNKSGKSLLTAIGK